MSQGRQHSRCCRSGGTVWLDFTSTSGGAGLQLNFRFDKFIKFADRKGYSFSQWVKIT
jgi:capsid portal protein